MATDGTTIAPRRAPEKTTKYQSLRRFLVDDLNGKRGANKSLMLTGDGHREPAPKDYATLAQHGIVFRQYAVVMFGFGFGAGELHGGFYALAEDPLPACPLLHQRSICGNSWPERVAHIADIAATKAHTLWYGEEYDGYVEMVEAWEKERGARHPTFAERQERERYVVGCRGHFTFRIPDQKDCFDGLWAIRDDPNDMSPKEGWPTFPYNADHGNDPYNPWRPEHDVFYHRTKTSYTNLCVVFGADKMKPCMTVDDVAEGWNWEWRFVVNAEHLLIVCPKPEGSHDPDDEAAVQLNPDDTCFLYCRSEAVVAHVALAPLCAMFRGAKDHAALTLFQRTFKEWFYRPTGGFVAVGTKRFRDGAAVTMRVIPDSA